MKIKAIVFDIGGVLVEDPRYGNFWKNKKGSKELRKKFGIGQLSFETLVKEGTQILGIEEKEFVKKYERAYSGMKLMKSSLEIYKKIRLDKYLFSDTNPFHLEVLRENFPIIFKLSKGNFLSPETGLRKSDKESFVNILNKLKLPAEEVVFIDNKKKYLKPAKKLGIKTILFKDAKKLMNDLEKLEVKLK